MKIRLTFIFNTLQNSSECAVWLSYLILFISLLQTFKHIWSLCSCHICYPLIDCSRSLAKPNIKVMVKHASFVEVGGEGGITIWWIIIEFITLVPCFYLNECEYTNLHSQYIIYSSNTYEFLLPVSVPIINVRSILIFTHILSLGNAIISVCTFSWEVWEWEGLLGSIARDPSQHLDSR